MSRLTPMVSLALLLSFGALPVAGCARADMVDEIAARKVINIGFRADAAPFSFLDDTGRAAGFSVDLCRRIADAISKETKAPLQTEFVAVGTSDWFDLLEERKIDLLCATTTVTVSRRARADFSLFTFVTGGTLMVRAKDAVPDLSSDRKAKIGVLANTTSARALQDLSDSGKVNVEIALVDTHDIAIGFLTAGVLDGYFGDRELLWDRKMRAADPDAFVISDHMMTLEPYAIAMKRGENRLRLISDRTLAELYRSGDIVKVMERWFPHARPTDLLTALYFIQSLPD